MLKRAWLDCDLIELKRLLSETNVNDHMYLLSCEVDEVEWKYKLRPQVAQVFLEACIAQKIESLEIEKVAVCCESIAEYSATRGNVLRARAGVEEWCANRRQKDNIRNCRASVTALLGCCGKQRRVRGGLLRNVSTIIAKQVWKKKEERRLANKIEIEGFNYEAQSFLHVCPPRFTQDYSSGCSRHC
jgi:hypothetical protein